jgi:predicted ester cyclase
MSTDANKAVVRHFVHEVFQELHPEAVDELVSDDFTSHSWPSPTGDGKADLKQATVRMQSALSDPKFEIEDMVAEGDLVCVRLTSSATQSGEFMGMPPTGRRYTIGEIHIFRIREGEIAEHWHQLDALGMLSQLKADT